MSIIILLWHQSETQQFSKSKYIASRARKSKEEAEKMAAEEAARVNAEEKCAAEEAKVSFGATIFSGRHGICDFLIYSKIYWFVQRIKEEERNKREEETMRLNTDDERVVEETNVSTIGLFPFYLFILVSSTSFVIISDELTENERRDWEEGNRWCCTNSSRSRYGKGKIFRMQDVSIHLKTHYTQTRKLPPNWILKEKTEINERDEAARNNAEAEQVPDQAKVSLSHQHVYFVMQNHRSGL